MSLLSNGLPQVAVEVEVARKSLKIEALGHLSIMARNVAVTIDYQEANEHHFWQPSFEINARGVINGEIRQQRFRCLFIEFTLPKAYCLKRFCL